ncbi:DNA topoisomerase IB [Paraconexibacter sp.]|uniref:DNA topoisomerase IB n=1 Tax=Paraconexibacter sp. TaxID=2949640 RepID=UPI00356863B3
MASAPTRPRSRRVRRVDPAGPGWRLRRRGRGFELLDQRGRSIRDEAHRDRVRALAIPPAWNEVWVCPDPDGHIQATGLDAAGRRQYRYHERFTARRAQAKFACTLAFARRLPDLRERVATDLDGEPRDERTVLACVVRLLDRGFFRVGTESYASKNRTFGLTTLEKRHVQIAHEDVLVFDYTAKHGRRRVQSVVDPRAAEIVQTLRRRRGGGERLFAHREGRVWRPVRADAVNAYVRDASGLQDVSAKTFRTWNATVLAAVAMAIADPSAHTSKRARERAMRRAADEVARYLGNTATVCRSAYIDPRVFDRWSNGQTIADAVHDLAAIADPGDLATHGEIEAAVLDLLAG